MIRKLLTIAALALAFTAAQAQPYPAKPIRMIVPFPPGGGTDILSRLVANKLTEVSKWTVVPDNRAGAGGTIGIAEAVRAAPTGYEMVMGQKDNMVVAPWLYKNLSYDPTKDLVAVAHVAYTPVVIVTRSDSKFKTLADVVAAARAAPDSITYGSPGNGTTIHLAGEIFKSAANIKMRHVPYKGFDVSTWYGLFMPAGTPKDVVVTVNAEVNKLLATPEMKAAIIAQGAEPQAMTPQELQTLLKTDYQKWKSIVHDSGATIE